MKILLILTLLITTFSISTFAECGGIDSFNADNILEKLNAKKEGRKSNFIIYPDRLTVWGTGFSEGLAKVIVDGKSGFINHDGKIQIEPKYELVNCFSQGLAAVKLNKKWGYIDKKGKTIIPAKFDNATPFSEGLALVRVGKLWGYIDKSGNFVILPKFETADSFAEGLASVGNYKKEMPQVNNNPKSNKQKFQYGFIDKKGDWAIQPTLDGAYKGFNKGMAIVSRNVNVSHKNGVFSESYIINKTGKELWILDTWYTTEFSEGFIVVTDGTDKKTNEDKYSFLNRNGKRVTNKTYEYLDSFSEGLAVAGIGDKWGYINTKGDFVIQPQFVEADVFSEGLAAVKKNDNFGFINKKNEIVIKPQFGWAFPFKENKAAVLNGNKLGYINREGKLIWQPTN